jgi:hypothetical protein
LSVDQNQRQCLGTRSPKETFYDRIFGKSLRLLREVKSLNLASLAFQPIYIGGKSDFFLVNVHTTNARTATKGWIINLNLGHDGLLFVIGHSSFLSDRCQGHCQLTLWHRLAR